MTSKVDFDFYWGSSSHNTVFRNQLKGTNIIIGPLDGKRAPEDKNGYWAMQALTAVDFSQTVRYSNLIGNIIGTDRQKALPYKQLVVAPKDTRSFYTSNQSYGYTFGFANLGDEGGKDGNKGNTSLPYTTAIMHGDYDVVLGTFKWNAAVRDHVIPASFYLDKKPAFFGTLAWPAFGPTLTDSTKATIGTIPAKLCYEQGKMPNCM